MRTVRSPLRSNPVTPTLCCLLLLFATFLATPAAAQPATAHAKDAAHAARDLAPVDPAKVGMSQEGLDKLGAAMRELVDERKLAGVITAVTRHGKLVHHQTYGKQDVDAGTPMTDDTIFRIYSMTKPIAGVALMTLYEEGKFTLDDPVEKHLPQLKGLKVAKADGPDGYPEVEDAHHPMTVRELMTHTGGLTYGLFSRSQTDQLYLKNGILDRDSTLEQMVDKLAKIPLLAQPGTQWQYSVSVDVQGRLAEVLSGKPFDQFLRERVFEPLGMKDTGFYVPEEKADRLSKLYVPSNDGKLVAQPSGEFLEPPKFLSGGGGLVSTLSDYLRFAQMLANGGELSGTRILKPETVQLMQKNHLPASIESINPLIGNPGNTFGLDLAIVENPDGKADHALAKGEVWWYGIGGTWFGVNPVQDLVVVGMIQSRGGRAARDARFTSKRLAYEAILDPVLQPVH